ncbi:rho GTPase-activating protein 27 isoform X2 [Thalassophryne amazonica]|uniref:rho GTPase-activating protein 27 isoform X2 n=1 Tax=Thalassophryne amazonica TaxID=390379 RepID=UPI00147112B0|nr:rho GTPase-activating protein 27 isoform X2 [Thalassophryne amazonica]
MTTASSLLGRGLGLVLVEFEYEYEARDGELVSIKPNERYTLLAKTNDHWWQVRKDQNTKPFYIPAKYVKELPTDIPSPLDFADLPCPKPVLVPVVAPVPVPVPVPKTLDSTEEPSGTRNKPGDEVMIRVRPDMSHTYRKIDNRMSTFGVPLEFNDLSAFVSAQRSTNKTNSIPAESGSTGTSGTTTAADSTSGQKQASHCTGRLLPADDQSHCGKLRVPSFSPADPITTTRSHTQAIPVETPVVPVAPPPTHSNHSSVSSIDLGLEKDQESPVEEREEEEEKLSVEESGGEEEAKLPQVEDSNHIYESIQDMNLDVEALLASRKSPIEPHEPSPDLSPAQHDSTLRPDSPIYTNISSRTKMTLPPNISISSPTHPLTLVPNTTTSSQSHSPSSSVSSSAIISPISPFSPQDGWQVHTDRESGKVFYYHPMTRRTTWSNPRTPPPAGQLEQCSADEDVSPTTSQGSGDWEKLLDECSGRPYYYNTVSGATTWDQPEPNLSPGPATAADAIKRPDGGPPPLPEEDYPVGGKSDTRADVTQRAKPHLGLIPRAQLDVTAPSGRTTSTDVDSPTHQQLPVLPQRLMGNGVDEDGVLKNWRQSVAGDRFIPGHRRITSNQSEVSSRGHSPDSPQCHMLEKAGILNKTKVVDNGRKIRKNWSQSWTVLHGGILTFHRDPKSAAAGNATKASQIVPEYTIELRGASISWASKDKSSKKNVLELKTRQGCEYLIQYDTESIICDWHRVIMDSIAQLDQDHLSEEEDEVGSDKEDKDRKRTSTLSLSGAADSEQRRIRNKLRRFLQRRPTLQSVKERGYIQDNVFGCHLDTLCHRENTTVPKFVEKCIRVVERRGLDVDGIYRVSGNLAVIQKLRHKADHEEQLDLEDGQWEEIHVITGALKLFFRELPEPLFPFSSFDKFIAAIQLHDFNLKVSYMKDLVRLLPLPNHNTMEVLFKHLRRVIEHRDSNRMSFQSVAIVFGPTLLRPQLESPNMTINMVYQSQIVELMLSEFQTIFSQS